MGVIKHHECFSDTFTLIGAEVPRKKLAGYNEVPKIVSAFEDPSGICGATIKNII